jgi:hypothetical protein
MKRLDFISWRVATYFWGTRQQIFSASILWNMPGDCLACRGGAERASASGLPGNLFAFRGGRRLSWVAHMNMNTNINGG